MLRVPKFRFFLILSLLTILYYILIFCNKKLFDFIKFHIFLIIVIIIIIIIFIMMMIILIIVYINFIVS